MLQITKTRTTLGLFLAGVVLACTDTPTESVAAELIVVQAYLYAGEPVTDITLTKSVALGEDPAEAPTVNDATVALIRSGIRYSLVSTGDSGRYHYPDADLTVTSGDEFTIEIEYDGQLVTGETVVPAPPIDVAIDGDTLWAPEFGFGFGGAGGMDQNLLLTTWSNSSQLLHYVVVEGLDEDAETILPEEIVARMPGRFRMMTEPTLDNFHEIRLMTLQNLGPHLARVYRVNQEYADLYENREQDSRDLNEPPSNIVGGLGVFSAFASEAVYFEVVRETS